MVVIAAAALVLSVAIHRAGAAAPKRSVEIVQEFTATNRIANADFEGSFTEGVAAEWKPFAIGDKGYHKVNARLGPIGGGVYGARVHDKEQGDWREDLMTIRLAGKTHLIDASREDVAKKLREVHGDDVITIVKYGPEDYFSKKGQRVPGDDPIAQGREFADHCLERSQQSGIRATCYYGVNEPHMNDADALAKVCIFEKAFTDRLHQHGMRSIVLNHSTGTPGDRRNMLIEPMRELLAVADFVGYHCYGGPTDELMCAPSSVAHSMRWRTFARWYEERGWRFPPMIYTEATTWGGWHDQFTPEAIRDDILCMTRRMTQTRWEIGMCLFCTGCWPGQIWCKWDMSAFPKIIDQLREYNLAHPVDAHSGVQAQQFGGTGEGFFRGVAQAFPTRAGSNVHLSAWLKYEFYDGWPCNAQIQVGVDKTGQADDHRAKSIEWSDDLVVGRGLNSEMWFEYSIDFAPTNEQSSVWVRAIQRGAGAAVRVSLDDVSAMETP